MIKGKPGNMTQGSTKETLDGISRAYFSRLSEDLLKGRFNFTPTPFAFGFAKSTAKGRIMITKGPGKTGERPLSIANPREKIVQKALAFILESIYEPIFTNNSHGFRPNKGVHSALKELYTKGGTYT